MKNMSHSDNQDKHRLYFNLDIY